MPTTQVDLLGFPLWLRGVPGLADRLMRDRPRIRDHRARQEVLNLGPNDKAPEERIDCTLKPLGHLRPTLVHRFDGSVEAPGTVPLVAHHGVFVIGVKGDYEHGRLVGLGVSGGLGLGGVEGHTS